ncbi:hypothetical protein CW357_11965 [Rummeliibacillus sp. TYF005]|uniref:hypothetical protein n=1 Tax=Rummeliibacillus sp. TYF005 TaxID=2058214 RepID=UPI000F549D2A|nr:hypothetical protein [Rummeliibacillus sp. TYF005]RPJ95091.1 hypothetical protein CW357_11965 [Rummeliibacillus sp. TYF005]
MQKKKSIITSLSLVSVMLVGFIGANSLAHAQSNDGIGLSLIDKVNTVATTENQNFIEPIFVYGDYYHYYNFEQQAVDSQSISDLPTVNLKLDNGEMSFIEKTLKNIIQKQYNFTVTKDSETPYNFVVDLSMSSKNTKEDMTGAIYGVLTNRDTKKEIRFDIPSDKMSNALITTDFFKLAKGNYTLRIVDTGKLKNLENYNFVLMNTLQGTLLAKDVPIEKSGKLVYAGTNVSFEIFVSHANLQGATIETKWDLYNPKTKKYDNISPYNEGKKYSYKLKKKGNYKFRITSRIKGTKTVAVQYHTIKAIDQVTPKITALKLTIGKSVDKKGTKQVRVNYNIESPYYNGHLTVWKKGTTGKYQKIKALKVDDISRHSYKDLKLKKGVYKVTLYVKTDKLSLKDTIKSTTKSKVFNIN